MYYVYILFSKKLNKKYIGYSSDLTKRLTDHNSGISIYTAKGIPWRLVYYECFVSKVDAQKEEKFLKSGKGRERMKYLLSDYFGRIA